MTATLDIGLGRDGYYIAWYFDGDEGGRLGDDRYTARALKKAKPEDWDHVKATLVAHAMAPRGSSSRGAFEWETVTEARKVLKAIKAALKDKSNKPWPAWALQAKAAGWTPPKGWTP